MIECEGFRTLSAPVGVQEDWTPLMLKFCVMYLFGLSESVPAALQEVWGRRKWSF